MINNHSIQLGKQKRFELNKMARGFYACDVRKFYPAELLCEEPVILDKLVVSYAFSIKDSVMDV